MNSEAREIERLREALSEARRVACKRLDEHVADAMVAHRWFSEHFGEVMNGRDFAVKCPMASAALKREIERLKTRAELSDALEDSALQEAITCGREAERLKWSKEVAALREKLEAAQKPCSCCRERGAGGCSDGCRCDIGERCESCDAPATKHDVEMVPLCDGCYDALKIETARLESSTEDEPGMPRQGQAHLADAKGASNISDSGASS